MQPDALIRELSNYVATKDPAYKARKWELAQAAIDLMSKVDFATWAFLYDATFSLLWQQMDDHKDTQQDIAARLIAHAQQYLDQCPLQGGDRTAWVIHSASVGMYAPYKHVVAYLAGMKPCHVYITHRADEVEVRRLEAYGHEVKIAQGDALDKAAMIREWCADDGVGCLIADIYQAIPLALFKMRTAPRQAYLSPGFQLFPADKVLVPDTQAMLSPRGVRVPSPMLREHLVREAEPLPRLGKIVYGVLGRYEKISGEYLGMVRSILDKNEDAVFVAYGTGTFEPTHPRMIRGGAADPQRALKSIDVYLDTYPHSGGVSVWEAMANGVPVVTREHGSVSEWNAFKPYVVQGAEAFIDGAHRLVASTLRPLVIDAGRKYAEKFIRPDAGQILEELVWQ